MHNHACPDEVNVSAIPLDVQSQAIRIARLVGLLGITYTHVWTGLTLSQFAAERGSFNSIVYWIVADVFGRNSVPLLSVISGWLFAGSTSYKGYPRFVGRKARVLILPMIAWNAITLVVVLAASRAGWHEDIGELLAPGPLINEITGLLQAPMLNYPTAFLRDIFVCMLAAPFLVRLPARWLVVTILFATAWSICQWQLYILLRPQILLFFLIGILVRRQALEQKIAQWPMVWIIVAFTLLSGLKVGHSIDLQSYAPFTLWWERALDNLARLAAAILFWRIALLLAESKFRETLVGLEKYGFLMFCSHILILRLFAAPASQVFGSFDQPLWPIFFLAQPAIALAGAVLMGNFLRRHAPMLSDRLSGGRLQGKGAPA